MGKVGSLHIQPKLPDDLRILAMYEAKPAKISKCWSFWPIIQLINRVCSSQQTTSSRDIYSEY